MGHLSKSAEVMKIVNNLMKAPEMAVTMQEFNKEMTKVHQFSNSVFFFLLSTKQFVTIRIRGGKMGGTPSR